jgi:low affinity Fe/Cu permease
MRQFGPPVMRKSQKKNGKTPILLTRGAKSAPQKAALRTANKLFADIANITSHEVGKAWVFAIALGTVVVWALSGPYFNYSDTWQLVINTGTTIVTFLMVFLIQNSQNRDSAAIQVKLDELIRVSKANNSFMGLEQLTDEELEEIKGKCEGRAKAVLEARTASAEAKHKLRIIDGDA